MKRVQEYFKEADIEKLINCYLYAHPISWDEVVDDRMTVREVKAAVKLKLNSFIERLQKLEVEESFDRKEYILFAHKARKGEFSEEVFSLVCLQELEEFKENAQTYAYEFMKQAEIMGFWVADTKLTQNNIYDLLADVMFEASFFGFEQQHLETEIQKLEKSAKEVEEAIARGERVGREAAVVFKELREKWGIEEEEEDADEQSLERKVWEANQNYNVYCKQAELKKIIELLGM